MGIMVSKDTENTELGRRISADLRAHTNSYLEEDEFDGAADYTEGTKKTSHFAWIWVILIVLAIISLVLITTF